MTITQMEVIHQPTQPSAQSDGFVYTREGFFGHLREKYQSYCTIAQSPNADLDAKFSAAEMATTIKNFMLERGVRL